MSKQAATVAVTTAGTIAMLWLVLLGMLTLATSAQGQGPLPTIQSGVPTAKQLSGDGKLQAYVDGCAKEEVTCVLPPGKIYTDGIRLAFWHGGTIKGAGRCLFPANSRNGWARYPQIKQINTTLISTNPAKPLITLKPTMGFTLRDLGLETEGIAIHYRAHRGWGPAHQTIRDVAFVGGEIGLLAGDSISDPNAADVHFDNCSWHGCKVGLQVRHNQGVNFTFGGQCYFYDPDVAIHLKGGGVVIANSLHGFGVRTWAKIDRGGPNLCPQVVFGTLYSDRSPPSRPPVIFDATYAVDQVKAIVNAIKVTDNSRDAVNAGHRLFLAPRDERVAARSVLRFACPEISSWPKPFDASEHYPRKKL